MPMSVEALLAAPAPIVIVLLLVRYLPSALLALLAGAVAVLVADERGERALAVLRLLRRPPGGRRRA